MSLITDIRYQQLGQLGETDPTALSPWLLQKLLDDCNRVGQHLFLNGPAQWWAEEPRGESIAAPVTVSSVTLTAGSKVVSAAGLTSSMHGCTVQCSGQNTQNRVFQTGASTYGLLMPHNGGTVSNGTMTVWNDCINLTDSSLVIIRPVMLAGLWELLPATNQGDLQSSPWRTFWSHEPQPRGGYPVSGYDRQAATPRQYLVDNSQLYDGGFVPQIRLNPMPDAQYQINWQQRRKFTKITAWTDTRTHIIPADYTESVYIPLVLERLVSLPQFQGSKDAVMADADDARTIMQALSDVQEERDIFVETRGAW